MICTDFTNKKASGERAEEGFGKIVMVREGRWGLFCVGLLWKEEAIEQHPILWFMLMKDTRHDLCMPYVATSFDKEDKACFVFAMLWKEEATDFATSCFVFHVEKNTLQLTLFAEGKKMSHSNILLCSSC